MVVLARVPEAGTLMLLANPELDEVETWKPVGAVTVIGAVMLAPEMVKLLVDEGVPKVVVRAVSDPETEMTGLAATAETVLVAVAIVRAVDPLVRVMSPL